MLQEEAGVGPVVSDARRARDRRALILIFFSAFLAVQVHWLFGALCLWVLLLGQLERRGILDRWNATRVLGGLLMLRTTRGQDTIEKAATPRKFWRVYGEVSLWTCAFVMVFIVLFLLLSFGLALFMGVEKTDAPASQLIPFPGVSPIIPFWWPAIAFVGALVIHEICSRSSGPRARYASSVCGSVNAGSFSSRSFCGTGI